MNYIMQLEFFFFAVNVCYGRVLQDLVSTIFKDYDPGLRPVINPKTTVNVSLRFGIIQLLDVVCKNICSINVEVTVRFV